LPAKRGGISHTEAEWRREIERFRPELAVPGYWDTLEENCSQWAQEVSVSPFWNAAKEKLGPWIADYRSQTGGDLLAQPGLPSFQGKGSARIQTKLYDSHRREGSNPAIAFSSVGPPVPILNDLVRTRVNCKFIDGVEYFTNRLSDLADELGRTCVSHPM